MPQGWQSYYCHWLNVSMHSLGTEAVGIEGQDMDTRQLVGPKKAGRPREANLAGCMGNNRSLDI
jgi:hypothetical protein